MRTFFLSAQAALYLSFLSLDLLGGHAGLADAMKYCSVLLCLAAALVRARGRERHAVLTAAALTFTVLADLFLLVLNRHYLAGVLFFWVVQGLYAVRIRTEGGWPLPVCLTLRLAIPAAALLALRLARSLDPLYAAVAVYFSQLLCNALESLALPSVPWVRRFRAGLWLFIGCDVCIGLRNLALPLPALLERGAALGIWFFYLPSQVLLTLSTPKEDPP